MEAALERVAAAGLFPSTTISNGTPLADIVPPPIIDRLSMTGGGAHKFLSRFSGMRVTVHVRDEMQSLIDGLNFALRYFDQECFYFDLSPKDVRHPSIPTSKDAAKPRDKPTKIYLPIRSDVEDPYLLVNIGTGVSILKVESNGSFRRVSGSGLGGGTYWGALFIIPFMYVCLFVSVGLVKLLTKNINSFDESLRQCQQGYSSKVDMTVGDIYGGDYASLNLDKNMTASFFGKFVSRDKEHLLDDVEDADICNGLMLMVTNNLGQIAYLLATVHQVKRIFFSGSFLRHSSEADIAAMALSNAVSFWSGGQMNALFLKHEGYLGALGAFLRTD